MVRMVDHITADFKTSKKSDYVCISGVQSENIFKIQYTLNLLPEIMESMMS
jgi:hypothetical protein